MVLRQQSRLHQEQDRTQIELTLSRDSWIEIYDANDVKLFNDLAPGGEQYSINGTAPFQVLFGFSPGVTIKYNGELFDHSRYSSKSIAKFKLPESIICCYPENDGNSILLNCIFF